MIILPIEIFAREARPISYLASKFVERGFPVLLGDQRLMQSFALRTKTKSIYIDKCLTPQKSAFYRNLPREVILISHDVEFTGAYQGAEYLRNRYSKIGLERAEFTIFHDAIERDLSLEYVHGIQPFSTEGSWYFESMQPDSSDFKDLKKIDDLFGNEFIFVPSNFGGYFRKEGIAKFTDWIEAHFDEVDYQSVFKEKILRRENERNLFIYSIKNLAERYSNKLFVLRPHPTESIKAWQSVPFPSNLIVCDQFTTRLMTIAASTLLHNGCTTGIDANLLGTPQNIIVLNAASERWAYADYVDNEIYFDGNSISGDLTFKLNNKKRKINKNSLSERLIDFCEKKSLYAADNILKMYTLSWLKYISLQNSHKYTKSNNKALKEKMKSLCPTSKICDLEFGVFIK